MANLTSTMFFIEPCHPAVEKLLEAKKPIPRKCVLCCVEDEPGYLDAVINAIDMEFDRIISMDWIRAPLSEIADTITEILTQDTGIEVFCTPMETLDILEVSGCE